MSTNSAIQWTTHTFNPWWGCIKVAQGCKNCYAEGVATRFYGRKVWGPNSERKIASEKVWHDPQRWNRAAENAGERARVFCLSMGDVLEDHPALIEPRKRLVGIIESTPWLDWQLLTKRPENAPMFGWPGDWPSNVWFGASAAIQSELEAVTGHVFAAMAAVRFLSLEPLCGPMDLEFLRTLCREPSGEIHMRDEYPHRAPYGPPLDWVIVGGESGKGARPCDLAWVGSIVTQCRAAGVACFVKQLGARPILDCPAGEEEQPQEREDGSARYWKIGFVTDPKGGAMFEWPEELQVRQFPAQAVRP